MSSRMWIMLGILLGSCFAESLAQEARPLPRPRPRLEVPSPAVPSSVQVWFKSPEGVRVDHSVDDREWPYQPLIAPCRQNFPQGVTSLMFSQVTGDKRFELKATLEVYAVSP